MINLLRFFSKLRLPKRQTTQRQPSDTPGGIKMLVNKLVPELQRRGLFNTEYEGKTLRENLGLPRPPDLSNLARLGGAYRVPRHDL